MILFYMTRNLFLPEPPTDPTLTTQLTLDTVSRSYTMSWGAGRGIGSRETTTPDDGLRLEKAFNVV